MRCEDYCLPKRDSRQLSRIVGNMAPSAPTESGSNRLEYRFEDMHVISNS
jgi:hypothetical protein